MLNRWKKLSAVAVLAMALPIVANAQSSRVEGMSLQGDYVKDYTGIYTYPSQVSHVGNLVYGEFGGPNVTVSGTSGTISAVDRGMGAVLGNLWEGRYGTWAIHLREWVPSMGQATTNSHPGIGAGGVDINNVQQSFDLMWGKRMGGTSVGLRLSRAAHEAELSVTGPPGGQNVSNGVADTNVFNRNILGLGAGLSFEMNPSTTFDGSILWQSRTFENTTSPATAPNTNVSDDSPTSFQLAARLMWQWQPNVMVVPVFKWYSFDYSYKVATTTGAGTTTSASALTQKGWQIGAAGNWTLNQNDLFVLGATLARNTVEQDWDVWPDTDLNGYKKAEESLLPAVFAALETHVNSWLTIRFGANQGVNRQVKLDPRSNSLSTPDVKESSSDFDMTLGCGVKVGGLQFDAIMDNDFYNRFNTLSSSSAPGYAKVTATYPW
jgi:hypothetical protein